MPPDTSQNPSKTLSANERVLAPKSTSSTYSSPRRVDKAREIAILILSFGVPIDAPNFTISSPGANLATRPLDIINLVLRIIAQLAPQAIDFHIARQARDRDRGVGGRHTALGALRIALVVKDLGVEGDFEPHGSGNRPDDGLALGFPFDDGAGQTAVEMDAALDDVDVGGVVLAVEAVLVVVRVVVLLADAVAESLHLELEPVVGARVAALGGGAVREVPCVLEFDDPEVPVGERLRSDPAGLVGLEVEEV